MRRHSAVRGSAMMVVLLIMTTLTLLGLGFLAMADTETLIASSGRDAEQLNHAAETALRLTKAWFDQPVTGNPSVSSQVRHRFLDTWDLRNPVLFDRTKRVFDHDGDSNTPMVLADGTSLKPYYRQGRTLWSPSAYLDIFHKPYRGDSTTAFMGTEIGPDILIKGTIGTVDFLDTLNRAIFTNQEKTGRISEIAIYAPPLVSIGGLTKRAGICTIKVTVSKHRRMGKIGIVPVVTSASIKSGERVMRMVLNEVPGVAANGPLEACGSLSVTGKMRAHWGKVIAGGMVTLSSDVNTEVPSAFPYKSFERRISGAAPGDDWYAWWNNADTTVEDPWLKILTASEISGFGSLGDQPLPYAQTTLIDEDHSNLFQNEAGVACASFDYAVMRAAAASGEEAARYFTFDSGTGLFKEMGVGAARSVRDWTYAQEGLFFFDTKDSLPPNGHGPGDPQTNLTAPIVIENVDWNFSGLLYLNAESIRISNVAGVNRVVIPPGEPFDDVNRNGRYDAGEAFANLQYPTTIVIGSPGSDTIKSGSATQSGTSTSPDQESYQFTTTTARDKQGIPITGQVNLFGVLFNAGDIIAEGTARHYGSLIAGGSVVQNTAGADSPDIFFDDRLNTGEWPPAEINFPRTHLSRWASSF